MSSEEKNQQNKMFFCLEVYILGSVYINYVLLGASEGGLPYLVLPAAELSSVIEPLHWVQQQAGF